MNDTRLGNSTKLLLILSFLILISVLSVRAFRPVSSSVSDPSIISLTTQASALRTYDDNALKDSKGRYELARARLWSKEHFEKWYSNTHNAGWTVQQIEAATGSSLVTTRYIIKRDDIPFKQWPEVMNFIQELSDSPGAYIQSLIITVPAGTKRNFKSIQIVTSIFSSK